MRVKEILSSDFKNEDTLKEDEKYLAIEEGYGEETPTKYILRDKEADKVLFQFEVPSPFNAKKDFEKDLCLKYGHGVRGFILSLFDYLTQNKEINPPYSPKYSPDIFFQKKGQKAYAFAVEEPTYQVGFFGDLEYVEIFAEYFGFKTTFILT